MEKEIEKIQKQLDKIMDNELVHLKADIAELKVELGVMGANLSWLIKTYWVVVTTSVGSLIAAILGLILK